MKRILLMVAYDGTNYHGWQIQNNGITIEGELLAAIKKATGEDAEICGASRTDAGVHSLGNLAVFETNFEIPGDRYAHLINSHLPSDIRITKSLEVSEEFNPRFLKFTKTYEYKILNRAMTLPTYERNHHNVFYKLDVEKMKEAAEYIVGEHDFAAFCGAGSQVQSTVREVLSVDIVEEELADVTGYDVKDKANEKYYDEVLDKGRVIKIYVKGKGFLYNMVRIIAGTLVDVGRGKISPEEVKDIIASCDRSRAGYTAPANGLTLLKFELEPFAKMFIEN